MPESKVISLEERAKDEEKPFLDQLLQEGARKLLQAAIENEVIDYIQFHEDRRDENGQRLVVRNTSHYSGLEVSILLGLIAASIFLVLPQKCPSRFPTPDLRCYTS